MTTLRALADAWALVLPRLPADVTPPEWPRDPGDLAKQLAECPNDGGDDAADYLDAYADGLRTWGREAAACEEEAAPPTPVTHGAPPSRALTRCLG